ncbi:sulfide/dihydroorotate dehydrogenase-like FAD/NAD-binding protein [Candidatus Woesearchaeota archaeon]|nr:sulfide/dihydroorotate dehydrogenase-like FAD/NAD-binding protein [Candidatus Woesearchaeota archaeon]
MARILDKQDITGESVMMRLEAPNISAKARPGQFVILRLDEKGERIPLTIADFDDSSVTVVFQKVGKTTCEMSRLDKGDEILDLVGPLGNPTDTDMEGKTVCVVGGGLGTACIYPIAKELSRKNRVIAIVGARTKELLIWTDKLEKAAERLIICTDDGSAGRKGFVTDALNDLLEKENIDLVITVGPPVMMKFVAKTTEGRTRTIASLNPVMVDGTGMCGGCRVLVDGKVRFACVDGPEFDAHKVDFDDLMNRNRRFEEEEHECRCC